jgi:hypothetical protein
VAVAAVIASKLFLWPLGLWLVLARRFRSLTGAIVVGAIVTAVAWWIIGFDGLAQYPHMLSNIDVIGEGRGCSLVALLMSCGVPIVAARAAALAASLALLIVATQLMHRPGGERHAFGLVVVATLTACPVVWAHYLVLLYIPIALVSPTLSALWFMPMLAVLAPSTAAHSYGWDIVPVVGAEMVVALRLCLPLWRDDSSSYARDTVATASAAAPS